MSPWSYYKCLPKRGKPWNIRKLLSPLEIDGKMSGGPDKSRSRSRSWSRSLTDKTRSQEQETQLETQLETQKKVTTQQHAT